MKLLVILLLCFGTWPGFSISMSRFPQSGIASDSTAEEFSSKEILKYYKNGHLKRRQTVFYTPDGKEYQTIFENFRKNGLRRDTWVMNPVNIIQLTKYDQKGVMKLSATTIIPGFPSKAWKLAGPMERSVSGTSRNRRHHRMPG